MKTAAEFRESTAVRHEAPPRVPSPGREIRLLSTAAPDRPGFDTALSRALLLGVGAGETPETLRLHRGADVLAFGRRDTVAAGYPAAVAAARSAGFVAVERLAGGRAAVFHPGTVAFSWALPDPEPPLRTRSRYREIAGRIGAALAGLGVDARIGELPGEYCPGAFSVNVAGRAKVMGVGQRLSRRAAHVGGVIVVEGGERLREGLGPVYRALGLAWDPAVAGALEDFLPGITVADVIEAVRTEFSASYRVTAGRPDPATIARAEELVADHLPNLGGRAKHR